jgi:CRP-like cAMP-binding protein
MAEPLSPAEFFLQKHGGGTTTEPPKAVPFVPRGVSPQTPTTGEPQVTGGPLSPEEFFQQRHQGVSAPSFAIPSEPQGEEKPSLFREIFNSPIELGKDLAASFSPEAKELDESLRGTMAAVEKLKSSDMSERQKQIVANIMSEIEPLADVFPAKSYSQLVGDVLGTALWVLPVGQLAAGVRTAEAVAKLGTAARVAQIGARGSLVGGAFGGAAALTEGEDLAGTIKHTFIGAAVGAPLEIGGVYAFKGLKHTASSALQAIKKGADKTGITTKIEQSSVVAYFRSLGSRISKDYGPLGKDIADRMNTSGENKLMQAGRTHESLTQRGLFDLDDNEAWALVDALEGRVSPESLTPRAKGVFEVVKNESKAVADITELLGVKVRIAGQGMSFEEEAAQRIAGTLTPEQALASKRGAAGLIKEVPFRPRENFFPHMVPSIEKLTAGTMREKVIADTVRRGIFKTPEEAARVLDDYLLFINSGGKSAGYWEKYLVESGQAKTLEQAKGMTSRFFKASRRPRFGNLESAREFDFPFYDPDPRNVLPLYFMKAYGTLNDIEVFGQGLTKLDSIIGRLYKDNVKEHGFVKAGNMNKEIRLLINTAMGAIEHSSKAEATSAFMRMLQIPKLAFAQLLNASQSVNTLLVSDAKAFFRSIPYAFREEGRMLALRSGATLEQVLRQSQMALGAEGNFGESFLKWTGFSMVEKFNRVLASNVGVNYARDVAEKLVKNPNNKVYRLRLQELGVNPENILARGGIAEDELLKAAFRVSAMTQFLSRSTDLPIFAQSPLGKAVFQFKSFGFQQTTFIKNRLVAQMRAGNYKGLARDLLVLSVVFPATGEVTADIRSLITGTERPTGALDRYISDVMAVGGLGIMADAFISAGYGSLADYFLGPSAGTATELVERVAGDIKRGKVSKSDARFLLNQTGFGRILSGYVFPNDKKEQETFLETLKEWSNEL